MAFLLFWLAGSYLILFGAGLRLLEAGHLGSAFALCIVVPIVRIGRRFRSDVGYLLVFFDGGDVSRSRENLRITKQKKPRDFRALLALEIGILAVCVGIELMQQ